MSITTYNELKTAVANWLHRSDLTARIPEFITIAEDRLNRVLRSRAQVTRATVTLSTSAASIALPTGWRETIAFNNDQGDELEEVTWEELPEIDNTGRPKYYAIADKIYFECTPGSAYDYTMTYYKALDLATDGTNTVLTNHRDLYLYGALIAAEPFLKNDQRLPLWTTMFNAAVKEVNNKSARSHKRLRNELFDGYSWDITTG